MKKNKFLYGAIPLYFLGMTGLLFYFAMELQPRIQLNPMTRLLILVFVCLCTYGGSRCLCSVCTEKAEKIMKMTFALYFVLYLSLLVNFTLLDPMFGRMAGINTVFSKPGQLQHYVENSVNWTPFATVHLYINSFRDRALSLSVIATNLVGNFVALMPMGLFLPLLFKKCRRFGPFVIATAVCVAVIEFLQMIFVVGACDIDDLILNVSGAIVMFGVLKIRLIRTAVRKVTVIELQN